MIISKNQPIQFEALPERCSDFDTRCYVPFYYAGDDLIYQYSEAEQLSAQLLYNNSFTSDPAITVLGHWTKGTGWTISAGSAIKAAGTASDIMQNTPLYNKIYKVVVVVSAYSAGSIKVMSSGDSLAASGSFTQYFAVSSPAINFFIHADSAFAGQVDSVELYEVVNSFYHQQVLDTDDNIISDGSNSDWETSSSGVVVGTPSFEAPEDPGCYKIQIIAGQGAGANIVPDPGITSFVNWDTQTVSGDAWTILEKATITTNKAVRFRTKVAIPITNGSDYLIRFDHTISSADFVTFTVRESDTNTIIFTEVYIGSSSKTNIINIPFNGVYLEWTTSAPIGSPYTATVDNVFMRKYGQTALATSNLFKIIDPAVQCETCRLKISFTNDNNAFGLIFETTSLPFIPFFRVVAELKNPTYKEDGKRLTDSKGQRYALNIDTKKKWELVFGFLPEWLHDVIRIAKIADHFYIDDVEYSPEVDDYIPEWKDNLKLASSRFEVFKAIENNFNANC